MAIDGPKEAGDADAVAIEDPEAARKAERAAELERLERAFNARMAAKVDKPPEPATPDSINFGPKPLERTEALNILSQARELLSGSRKLEYFGVASGNNRLTLRGLPGFPQMLDFVRRMFSIIRPKINQIDELVMEFLMDPEIGHSVVICLLQWFYLKEHFPWALNELSPDERSILDRTERTMQLVFAEMPEMAALFIEMANEHGDLTLSTATVLTQSRGMPGFTPEKLLDETQFTRNDFRMACEWLHLKGKDIQACVDDKEGKYLDLGCGLSNFADGLRGRGVAQVFTLDELSIDEIIEKVRQMPPQLMELLRLEEPLQELEAKKRERELWHRKGLAKDTHRIFGDDFFKGIFAVDSITQVTLCPLYRKNPHAFWENIAGPLRALSPNRGELRATTNPYILYSQTDMEAYMLAFLMAMRVGRFEIPGAYGTDGAFSFQEFMKRYVRWEPEKMPVLRVRRHPSSNIDAADRFMKRALAKDASLEKLCAEIS